MSQAESQEKKKEQKKRLLLLKSAIETKKRTLLRAGLRSELFLITSVWSSCPIKLHSINSVD